MSMLPDFDESSPDIPVGYGIEQSYDGGWYPYHIDEEDDTQIDHLTDSLGLDLRCATREQALAALQAKVADEK